MARYKICVCCGNEFPVDDEFPDSDVCDGFCADIEYWKDLLEFELPSLLH